MVGYEEGKIRLNPLFLYNKDRGLETTGNLLINRSKLELRGVAPDDGL